VHEAYYLGLNILPVLSGYNIPLRLLLCCLESPLDNAANSPLLGRLSARQATPRGDPSGTSSSLCGEWTADGDEEAADEANGQGSGVTAVAAFVTLFLVARDG